MTFDLDILLLLFKSTLFSGEFRRRKKCRAEKNAVDNL